MVICQHGCKYAEKRLNISHEFKLNIFYITIDMSAGLLLCWQGCYHVGRVAIMSAGLLLCWQGCCYVGRVVTMLAGLLSCRHGCYYAVRVVTILAGLTMMCACVRACMFTFVRPSVRASVIKNFRLSKSLSHLCSLPYVTCDIHVTLHVTLDMTCDM